MVHEQHHGKTGLLGGNCQARRAVEQVNRTTLRRSRNLEAQPKRPRNRLPGGAQLRGTCRIQEHQAVPVGGGLRASVVPDPMLSRATTYLRCRHPSGTGSDGSGSDRTPLLGCRRQPQARRPCRPWPLPARGTAARQRVDKHQFSGHPVVEHPLHRQVEVPRPGPPGVRPSPDEARGRWRDLIRRTTPRPAPTSPHRRTRRRRALGLVHICNLGMRGTPPPTCVIFR